MENSFAICSYCNKQLTDKRYGNFCNTHCMAIKYELLMRKRKTKKELMETKNNEHSEIVYRE